MGVDVGCGVLFEDGRVLNALDRVGRDGVEVLTGEARCSVSVMRRV